MANEGLTKAAILAMEQVYLPRILTLEVALITSCGIVEDHLESLPEGEVKKLVSNHLSLLTTALNNKEYLKRVFDEDMKTKLKSSTFPLNINKKEN